MSDLFFFPFSIHPWAVLLCFEILAMLTRFYIDFSNTKIDSIQCTNIFWIIIVPFLSKQKNKLQVLLTHCTVSDGNDTMDHYDICN